MHRHRLFSLFIVVSFVFTLGGLPAQVSAVAPTAFFGYTVEKLVAADWVPDITSGTQVTLGSIDAISDEIPILFPPPSSSPFPFFENDVTSLKICTNGIITFDTSLTNCASTHQRIPVDYLPNDLVAAFWDSLVLGSGSPAGKVYTKAVTMPNRFVIEWNNVNRSGSTDKLSFQIVLYENGNIDLNYKPGVSDTSHNTIGIEDSDGADGIQAYFNGAGFVGTFTGDMSLRFTYPISTEHVKGLPAYQSAFLKDGVAEYRVTAVNTGAAENTYTLNPQIIAGETGWDVEFFELDFGGDITSTGPVSPGGQFEFLVRVTAPVGADIGDFARVKVNMTGGGGASCYVTIQAAISSSYVQMFSDVDLRINLDVVTQSEQYSKLASNAYDYDNSLVVAHIDPDEYWYLSVWNPNVNSLQYSRTNALFGYPKVQQLTDNSAAPIETRDETPAIDVFPDGTGVSGVPFVRTMVNDDGKLNINVYLARISKDGVKLGDPVNITNKTDFHGTKDPFFPHYQSPQIAALSDGYLLTWVRGYYDLSGEYKQDVDVQAVDANGALRGSPLTITGQISNDYDPLSIKHYDTNNNFVTFFSADNKLHVVLVNDNGGLIATNTFTNVTGKGLDMVRLGNSMLITWTNTLNNKINFAFLTNTGTLHSPIMEIEPPDGRYNDVVSATYDFMYPDSRAILTWENLEADRLYYAMVDEAGAVTPPMIYRQAKGTLPVVHTGAPGASLSPLPYPLPEVWSVNLPVISK